MWIPCICFLHLVALDMISQGNTEWWWIADILVLFPILKAATDAFPHPTMLAMWDFNTPSLLWWVTFLLYLVFKRLFYHELMLNFTNFFHCCFYSLLSWCHFYHTYQFVHTQTPFHSWNKDHFNCRYKYYCMADLDLLVFYQQFLHLFITCIGSQFPFLIGLCLSYQGNASLRGWFPLL